MNNADEKTKVLRVKKPSRKMFYILLSIMTIITLVALSFGVLRMVKQWNEPVEILTTENTEYSSECPEEINNLTKKEANTLQDYKVHCVDTLAIGESQVRGLTNITDKKVLINLQYGKDYQHTFYHELGHVISNRWDENTISAVSEKVGKPWSIPTEFYDTSSEIVAETYAVCRMQDNTSGKKKDCQLLMKNGPFTKERK